MATYARKLKDGNGSYICPVTRSDLVYFPDNTVLSKLTFYPVGSVYQSFSESSPASLFGGEWEKLENTFLYGSGTKSIGDTGGEETHVLTINELAYHCHYNEKSFLLDRCDSAPFSDPNAAYIDFTSEPKFHMTMTTATGYAGRDQPHNNMPPYIVCNIWKRTA